MARDDFYASLFGKTYSFYMERPRLSRVIAWLLWGTDVRPYYESMAAIGEVRAGGTIVDCPCGAGPAFRELRPDRDLRCVAADLSPAMLARARRRAEVRGLSGIEFLEADATELPLEDESADLFVKPGFLEFGQIGSQADVEGWLESAGLSPTRMRLSKSMLFFEAAKT